MGIDKYETAEFSTVAEALHDVRLGRPVIVVDDEDRENEGDLVVAAQLATPRVINFMASAARGLICVPMMAEDLDRLGIPMMVTESDDRAHASPFTVSVEAATGVTTGISAADRAATIGILAAVGSQADDIVMPGHVFPLRAHPDGLRGRRGHTEASLELVRLAGLRPAAVICEIMNDDGTMARRHDLASFARKYELSMVTISDIETFQLTPAAALVESGVAALSDPRMSRLTEAAALPTRFGAFRVYGYVDEHGLEHLAVIRGDVTAGDAPLVRVHSECLTGDAFGSVRCDCGDQLSAAMQMIAEAESGMLLYLRQEGRGIGLANKIRAYALQDRGFDTVEANQCLGFSPDEREYDVAVAILREFDVRRVRLLTNNPAKLVSLEEGGIKIEERIPIAVARAENSTYMRTKAEKLQHLL